jgi:hypothetical protein
MHVLWSKRDVLGNVSYDFHLFQVLGIPRITLDDDAQVLCKVSFIKLHRFAITFFMKLN